MKPKVAVLVFGEFREFENAHKSWKFLNDINYDLFMSTWDTSMEINKSIDIHLTETVNEDQILKYFPNAYVDIQSNPECGSNSARLIIHLRSLFNMMTISGNEYDLVILLRPDLFLIENKSFGEYINNITDHSIIYGASGVHQEPPPMFLYTDDCLFVGSSSLMRNTFLSFRSSDLSYKGNHYQLARHFIDNDVYVKQFSPEIVKYFVMRSIHREFLTYDIETLMSIGDYWFTKKHNLPTTVSDKIISIVNGNLKKKLI